MVRDSAMFEMTIDHFLRLIAAAYSIGFEVVESPVRVRLQARRGAFEVHYCERVEL